MEMSFDKNTKISSSIINRANGSWLGMMIGDALGCPYEFLPSMHISKIPAEILRQMCANPDMNHVSGQITDDSEMAIALALSILESKSYSQKSAFAEYQKWYRSNPIDCGITIAGALNVGDANFETQANGALMRIAPLGIYAASLPDSKLAEEFAELDAFITHPNEICIQVNRIFVSLLCKAIKETQCPKELYKYLKEKAIETVADESIIKCINLAEHEKPKDYMTLMGWVLIAFHNALWQMLHAKSFEDAILDTIKQGGDTDTNAAICGTLLGAIYGENSIPKDWIFSILTSNSVRPSKYHPKNCMDFPARLLNFNT